MGLGTNAHVHNPEAGTLRSGGKDFDREDRRSGDAATHLAEQGVGKGQGALCWQPAQHGPAPAYKHGTVLVSTYMK